MKTEAGVRAVVAHGRDDLRVDVLEAPIPGPDESLVAIELGGICGSDLHYWLHGAAGESILKDPLVLGHEIIGRVVRSAEDGSGPAEGVRVAVHPATPGPGDGPRFPSSRPNLSPGGTYLGSAATHPHRNGAFADVVALPSRMLRPIPGDLDARTAALIEPLSVAWHAVKQAGDVAGRRVLVVGAGPIGALVVAVLSHHGAGEIFVTDLFEAPLARAKELGASRTVLASEASELEGLDADVVIESSGSAPGLRTAIRAATRGGRVVMLGLLPPGDQPVPVSIAIARELELVGSFRFNDEIDEVIAALAAGEIDPSAVVTHVFDVDEALEAFAIARDASTSGKVLLRFGHPTVTSRGSSPVQ
ncbi:L-idonate 5-dehydrogenase [Sinomonas humi]|uniref:L-idonate 5-dehydrogenase n=1 Tax=Sinomonas humi TaxID=1338436 RepID=UPI00068D63F7|nr:L-idonate 5-dehydrogenase [Sinomonas humi]